MRILITIFFIFISIFVQAQTYSSLKGLVYSNWKEIAQLKNCVEIEARVDTDRYICRHLFDTVTSKHIMYIEKETTRDTMTTYKILDIIDFESTKGALIFIGSNENKKGNTQNTFVVDIECCYHIHKSEDWPVGSKRIIKAWTFDKLTNNFEKLNPKKIYRSGEGFNFN